MIAKIPTQTLIIFLLRNDSYLWAWGTCALIVNPDILFSKHAFNRQKLKNPGVS